MTDRRTLGAAFGSVNLNGRLRYRYQNRLADTLRHIVADLRDSNVRKGAAPRSGLCSFVTGILRLLLNVYDHAIEVCFALLSSFTGYSLPCSGPLCLFSDPYHSNYVPCAQKYWALRKISSDHGGWTFTGHSHCQGSHILLL